MKIWIDADACPRPVKEIVFRASERLQIPVCLVANTGLAKHHSRLVSSVIVPGGLDVADDYIAEQATAADLVITADIPLAATDRQEGRNRPRPPGGAVHRPECGGAPLGARSAAGSARRGAHPGGTGAVRTSGPAAVRLGARPDADANGEEPGRPGTSVLITGATVMRISSVQPADDIEGKTHLESAPLAG